MSASPTTEKLHEAKELDLTLSGRGVWLVKVPKYLSQQWQKSPGDVGKLRISRTDIPGRKPEVTLKLNDEISQTKIPGQPPVPKDHKLMLTGVGDQNLVVFSQSVGTDKLAVEGKVIQRAECRPDDKDGIYMKRKRIEVMKMNQPKREVIQIKGVVPVYKPKSDHEFNIQHQKKLKEDGKRTRDDKEKVQNMLFAAFEKHQYYNISDLVRITNQPISYLKEILKEICIYNMKAPHKNMWELRPEYRHYKDTTS
ncbi:hypothetical protein ACJMK2_019199 [Sinanodonta woodiana]|uniref:General transcription factor IIF subunit 2 n=1 Tax=Sinanodonta woodiana TaxID=1069815 RepID=A0ABD3UFN8_SINWO